MKKRVMKIFTSLFLICATVLLPACARVSVPEKDSEEAPTSSEKVECNHVYEYLKQVEATCETDGETIKVCTDCGKTLTETKKALGHHAVKDEAKPGSCLESALTEGAHCDRCGEVLLGQQEIIGDHKYGEDGICSVCHDGLLEIEISPFESAAGNWYRIYRGEENTFTLNYERSLLFFAAPQNSEYSDIYCLYAEETPVYLEGLNVIYTPEYIDLFFELKGYNIINIETKELLGKKTIYGDATINATGSVYCLKKEVDLIDTSNYEEVKIQANEKVLGNWYRIYRQNGLRHLRISNKGTLQNTSFYASKDAIDKLYGFYDDDRIATAFILDGMKVVYTEDYVDICFEKGTYYAVNAVNKKDGTVVIDEQTTITYTASKVYRLQSVS